jgi:HSP20 family molecular chaperone IbpA
MTVAANWEVSEKPRGGQGKVPRVAGVRGWRAGGSAAWRPAIDVSERAGAYLVMVEIPGVMAGKVEVTMEDGLLTIQGERHAPRSVAGDKMHRSERGHGVFRRLVTLPSSHVDADRSEASVRDGLLEILVPKALDAPVGLVRIRVSQEYAVLAPRHDDEGQRPC